jgi:protein-tyrosine kinase
MNAKSSHLIERAAAQLLKSGGVDGSVASLLAQDKQQSSEATVNLMPTSSLAMPEVTLPFGEPPLAEPSVSLPRPALSPVIQPQDAAPSSPPEQTIAPPSQLPFAQPTASQILSGTLPAAAAATAPLTPKPAIALGRPAIRLIDRAALDRAGLIDWEQARSRISEEFRLSQRQILRNAASPDSLGNGSGNLIMVTSARPGEGKSFISLNLAASIARQRDHDVLLVDIDYKPDSIGTHLGLSGQRGLLDLVTDPTLDPDQLIVRTAIENFSILPIGLGRRYADRLVILDAPPCLATSEPGALAPVVGQVVLVVEAEKTQREEVESALDLIQTCPTITLLLNKVQRSNRYGFGAYSSSYSAPYSS